jgi:hypothetical protein
VGSGAAGGGLLQWAGGSTLKDHQTDGRRGTIGERGTIKGTMNEDNLSIVVVVDVVDLKKQDDQNKQTRARQLLQVPPA